MKKNVVNTGIKYIEFKKMKKLIYGFKMNVAFGVMELFANSGQKKAVVFLKSLVVHI